MIDDLKEFVLHRHLNNLMYSYEIENFTMFINRTVLKDMKAQVV